MIDQFVSEGVLIPDTSFSHTSPLVIVHKMEGGIRMEVDYREVNQFLRVSANQLRYQDMLLQQLAGQLYYAKVDNLWGVSWISKVVESQRSLHHEVCIASCLAPSEFRLHRTYIDVSWLLHPLIARIWLKLGILLLIRNPWSMRRLKSIPFRMN